MNSAKLDGGYLKRTVTMPELGQNMTKGKVVKWLRKKEDAVKEGELLFEVTALGDVAVNKIASLERDDVSVRQTIAFIEGLL